MQGATPTPEHAPIRRVASVIRVPAENLEEYKRYHQAVWPDVLRALSQANVTNYSIYRHGDLLFSYLEYRGADYEGDMARIAEDEATRRWWAIMMPLQRTLRADPADPWWVELEELFHLD